MEFQPTDSVTLNHMDMNELVNYIINSNIDEAKFLKLFFNEKLYLKKITSLKKELNQCKKAKSDVQRQLAIQSAKITSLGNEINLVYNNLQSKSEQLYSLGTA